MSAVFTCYVSVGTVKKLSASYWEKPLGAAGAWDNANASNVANGSTLTLGEGRDILIISDNNHVTVKFTPDSSLADGQGYIIPVGFPSVTVENVIGTVKVLPYDKQHYSNTVANSYYALGTVVAVKDMKLYPGDIICCANTLSSFSVNFSLDETFMYQRVGFDLILLSNVMYS